MSVAPQSAHAAASARDLEPAGEFSTTRTYKFEFNNVEMPYESYNGVNVRLKCVPCAEHVSAC